MSKIILEKAEYQALKEKAERYDRITSTVEADFFAAPPVRSRKAVLAVLKKTNRYPKKFLDSLNRGLRRSSYFTP